MKSLDKYVEEVAYAQAATVNKVVNKLLAMHNLNPENLQGYKVFIEKRGDEEYAVLCKPIDRVRIPKIHSLKS